MSQTLCSHLFRKRVKRRSDRVSAAELGGFEPADDVLQRGSYHKVLLLQTQLLPLKKLHIQDEMVTAVTATH